MLPFPETGKNDKETLNNLFDAYFKLRKELEWLLHHLDDNNILEVDAAKIKNLEAYLIVSNTIVTQTLYANMGTIAELTVDRLETSDKVYKYKISDPSRIDYIRIYDKNFEFVEATVKSGNPSVQLEDRIGNKIYWVDETMIGTTLDPTPFPVMIYDYNEVTKLRMYYELDSVTGYYVPKMEWGAGSGITGYPERGKSFIYKNENGMFFEFINDSGKISQVQINDYVDANHRRLKSCDIDKTAGTVTVLMEGQTYGDEIVIDYVEGTGSITYTWPDSFTTTVTIS